MNDMFVARTLARKVCTY